MNTIDILRDEIRNCYHTGNFRLSCGIVSTEYFDLAPLLLNTGSLARLTDIILLKIRDIRPTAFATIELCPVPLLGALLTRTRGVHGLIVRKSRKDHGTGKLVEGTIIPNERVVLIEDVTSTGKSIEYAAKTLESLGLSIACILTVLNRDEGCSVRLSKYDFRWVFTKDEVLGEIL